MLGRYEKVEEQCLKFYKIERPCFLLKAINPRPDSRILTNGIFHWPCCLSSLLTALI